MEQSLREIILLHSRTYPKMEIEDYLKLIYQNEFGPGHLVGDPAAAEAFLREECGAARDGDLPLRAEPIGNGLCRVHFSAELISSGLLPLIGRFFVSTANTHRGEKAAFAEKLQLLEEMTAEGLLPLDPVKLRAALSDYLAAGCPAVHHSESYRKAYRPRYRVLRDVYPPFFPVFSAVQKLMEGGAPKIVAIDGRCGSGKTFLAKLLAEGFGCSVFHMDDFFLPPEAKTEERLAQPGGNVDYERFLKEVLRPLTRGETVHFRPFDCGTGALKPEVTVPGGGLSVIEGSYSQHPSLCGSYDLRIFLTCSPKAQLERIRRRSGGELLQRFQTEWIPLEERYFRACAPDRQSDLVMDTTEFFSAAAGAQDTAEFPQGG